MLFFLPFLHFSLKVLLLFTPVALSYPHPHPPAATYCLYHYYYNNNNNNNNYYYYYYYFI